MAELNLLRGGYRGRVGDVVGQKRRSGYTAKIRCQHIVHIGTRQRRAVRAFECVNRIASCISKHLYQYMGLDCKNMHPHNAVAKICKPCLANGAFDPNNLSLVFAQTGENSIADFSTDSSSGLITATFRSTFYTTPNDSVHTLAMIFDTDGEVYASKIIAMEEDVIRFYQPIFKDTTVYAFMCSIDCSGSRPIFKGYALQSVEALGIVVNGVLYTSRMKNVDAGYVPPSTVELYGNVDYLNGFLLYPKP